MAGLSARRRAQFLLFLVQGVAMSSWVTRTPAVRDAIHASTAQIGFILFGLSIGSMISVLAGATLVARFGTRRVSLVGSWCFAASMPVLAAGAHLHLGVVVAAGLCWYGLGVGSTEVSLNIDAAEVERISGRPVLAALHGCFSLGTVVGAVVGIWLAGIDFPVTLHLLIVGAVVAGGVLAATPFLPDGVGVRAPSIRPASPEGPAKASLLRDPVLIMIGVIVLAMALAEGTANDWLPLLMVDEHGFAQSWGAAGYALFAAGMTVGRFLGNRLLVTWSHVVVLRLSALFGAVGLVAVMVADSQSVVVAAVVLWGLGASLGFPVSVSAAGASGPNSVARVGLVSTIGYIAFLAGPPVIGVLGSHIGLRSALVLPLVMIGVAAFLTPAVSKRQVTESTVDVANSDESAGPAE